MARRFILLIIIIGTACTASSAVQPATGSATVVQNVEPTQTATVRATAMPPLSSATLEPTATVEMTNEEAENGRLPNLNGREIIIAVENRKLPFNYILLEGGEAGGWDYAVWHEICVLLNCEPVFETAVWSHILPAVANGQVDVAANGIVITPERSEIVAFSDSYMRVEQRLMARSSEHLFTTINEFLLDPSLTVGVRTNDATHDTASDFFDAERIFTFDQQPALFDALANHEVYAIILNVVILDPLNQDYVGANANWFKFASHALSRDELGFAFSQGSDLVQPVNLALQELWENGTLDKLAEDYFSANFSYSHTDIER
ncbi:MAG: amino acid ABC transporter substrate-binding protein [Chloroflexi bacterium]|nr:amino acid ABC transporter substrate-binding protein [Chloroflexota bacterium]